MNDMWKLLKEEIRYSWVIPAIGIGVFASPLIFLTLTNDEDVIADSGHVPFITHPEVFNRTFHAHLERTSPPET